MNDKFASMLVQALMREEDTFGKPYFVIRSPESLELIIKAIKDDFPKPRISTDLTHTFGGDDEIYAKGEVPHHDISEYPRYYNEPSYKQVKEWFEKWFGKIKTNAEPTKQQ